MHNRYYYFVLSGPMVYAIYFYLAIMHCLSVLASQPPLLLVLLLEVSVGCYDVKGMYVCMCTNGNPNHGKVLSHTKYLHDNWGHALSTKIYIHTQWESTTYSRQLINSYLRMGIGR